MNITYIDSWPYPIALTFVCGGFLLTFTYIGASIYISKKYLPNLLEALPNSPYAQSLSRNISQKSLTSRALTFSLIAGLTLFKKSFVRTGDLCQSDIENFPRKLERIIKIEFSLAITALTWMILIGLLFKIQEGNSV